MTYAWSPLVFQMLKTVFKILTVLLRRIWTKPPGFTLAEINNLPIKRR